MKVNVNISSALLAYAKYWKQPKCPQIEELLNKLYSIHTLNGRQPLKKRGVCGRQGVGWGGDNFPKLVWNDFNDLIFK